MLEKIKKFIKECLSFILPLIITIMICIIILGLGVFLGNYIYNGIEKSYAAPQQIEENDNYAQIIYVYDSRSGICYAIFKYGEYKDIIPIPYNEKIKNIAAVIE